MRRRPALLLLPLALALVVVAAFLAAPPHASPGAPQEPRGRLANVGLDHWDSSDPPPELQPAGIPGDAVELALADFAFEPGELNIPAGSAVHFINRGTTAHTVTGRAVGDTALALDNVLRPGEGFTWEAPAGEFLLRCRYHSDSYGAGPMRATLYAEA